MAARKRSKVDPQIRQMGVAARAALKALRAKQQEDRRALRAKQMADRVDEKLVAKKALAALLQRQAQARANQKVAQAKFLENMKRGQKEALLRVKQALRMAKASAASTHKGPPRGKVRYI